MPIKTNEKIFRNRILDLVSEGANYLDAIVQVKEVMAITDEDVAKLLDPIIKERLENEAKNLRLIHD